MHRLFLILVAILPGCLVDDAPEPAGDPAAPEEPGFAWPEPVEGEQELPNQNFTLGGSFQAALDVQNIAGEPICSNAQQDCRRHAFTTNITLDMRAVLSWGLQANDLDLYLFQDGIEVSREGINNVGDAPNTQQVMPLPDLPPGAYELVVVPWNAANEQYTLNVSFTR